MTIDARNKLKPEDITYFLENASDDIHIISGGLLTDEHTNRRSFVQCLMSLDFIQDEDGDKFNVICKSSNDVTLVITRMDVNWWKQNARRYNKLYKAAEAFNKIPEKTYDCAIATLIEGHLTQINKISGTKEAITKALNDDIRKRYIDSFLKAQIVINLAYEKGDEDDIEQWHTLDELREIGAIKLS